MSNGYFEIRLVRVSKQKREDKKHQPKTYQQQQQHGTYYRQMIQDRLSQVYQQYFQTLKKSYLEI